MITVSNGIDTFSITKGAFPVYKTMGFKPISQWSSIEVKKYANLNGIDISRAKNLKEGKAIVKRHFDEVAKSNM